MKWTLIALGVSSVAALFLWSFAAALKTGRIFMPFTSGIAASSAIERSRSPAIFWGLAVVHAMIAVAAFVLLVVVVRR